MKNAAHMKGIELRDMIFESKVRAGGKIKINGRRIFDVRTTHASGNVQIAGGRGATYMLICNVNSDLLFLCGGPSALRVTSIEVVS